MPDLTTLLAKKLEALRATADSPTADNTTLLTGYISSVQANTDYEDIEDLNTKLKTDLEAE